MTTYLVHHAGQYVRVEAPNVSYALAHAKVDYSKPAAERTEEWKDSEYMSNSWYVESNGEHVGGCMQSIGDDIDFPLTFNDGDRYVVIDEASDGEGYMYDIYESKAAYEDDEDSVDGGQCTGSLSDAIDMALN